jgi:hypothetical protein
VRPVSGGLPQHPDQHRPEDPVLLAVNQEFSEGSALRVAPELPDPLGPLEVGEHEDAEEFGLGEGYDWVECGACGAGWKVAHFERVG